MRTISFLSYKMTELFEAPITCEHYEIRLLKEPLVFVFQRSVAIKRVRNCYRISEICRVDQKRLKEQIKIVNPDIKYKSDYMYVKGTRPEIIDQFNMSTFLLPYEDHVFEVMISIHGYKKDKEGIVNPICKLLHGRIYF